MVMMSKLVLERLHHSQSRTQALTTQQITPRSEIEPKPNARHKDRESLCECVGQLGSCC